MSRVNNYMNIIEIFDKKHKKYPNTSIFYFGFWMRGVLLFILTSYIHGTF